LESRGFRVFVVAEAATMFFEGGLNFTDLNGDVPIKFQNIILKTQMHLEDSTKALAEALGKPAVILCDRGCMDGSAYISRDDWTEVLKRGGKPGVPMSVVDLRDSRYDAILHLITAADGAEAFYGTATNAVRTESPELAREVDGKTKAVWHGHPRHFIFDNSTDFENKMQRVVSRVGQLVGLPSYPRRFKKFRLNAVPELSSFPLDATIKEFDVEKVYLATADDSKTFKFLRKRQPADAPDGMFAAAYGLTTVTINDDGTKHEKKRIITRSDFEWLKLNQKDASRKIVKQRRICSMIGKHYFEVSTFGEESPPLCLLNVQLESGVNVPKFMTPLSSFLDIGPEADDDATASAYHISLKVKA